MTDVGADENITMDLRYVLSQTSLWSAITNNNSGTRFTLSRDELLTLPEFVLLSLFPNGLLPDGHVNSYQDGDAYQVDVCTQSLPPSHPSLYNLLSNLSLYIADTTSQYDPASLTYMLGFFRDVAQTIPEASSTGEHSPVTVEPTPGSARDMLQDRAGIIVLRRSEERRVGKECPV